MIAVSLVAAAFLFAAVPSPAPSPVPVSPGSISSLLGTPVPDLPEIGRVRATSRSCAILRDVLIPSFNAAKRADDFFSALSTAGPAYASAAADREISDRDTKVENRNGSEGEHQRARMDTALAGILQETQVIAAALSDARFAAGADDQKVVVEQQQLRDLLDAQAARANLLNEFASRTAMQAVKQLPPSTALNSAASRGVQTARGTAINNPPGLGAVITAPEPTPTPRPKGPLEYLPVLSGDALHDGLAMHNWYRSLSAVVHTREYLAANAFLDIAKDCK